MDDADKLHRAIGSLYEAALDQSVWSRALAAAAQAVDATAAFMYAFDPRTSQILLMKWWGHDEAQTAEYLEHYSKICPRTRHSIAHGAPPLQYDYMHTAEEDIGKDEYTSWMSSYGFRYYIGGAAINDPTLFAGIALQRTAAQGHVQRREIAVWSQLVPHVRRAAQLAQRFGDVELRAAAAEDALEGAPWGLALLDRSGRVLFMNREARRIVGSGEGLAAGPEGLRGLRQVDDAPLQRLIEGAIGVALGLRLGGGGSMAFPKRSSPRPYAVTVTPLPQREALFASLRPAAAVLVVDPDRAPEAPPDALRRVYGLTPAEAQVCQALAAGRSVQQVAEAQAVRTATVRRHLEAIFRKTGTRRQAELVGLLLRLAQAGAPRGAADG